MPSPALSTTRRAALSAAVVALSTLAGYATDTPDGTTTSTDDVTTTDGTGVNDATTTSDDTTTASQAIPVPSGSGDPPAGPEPYPGPPASLTDRAAVEAAYEYEGAWIENSLADETCLASYGAAGIVSPQREIVDRGPDAVLVQVLHQLSMAWETDEGDANVDGYSEARYYVSTERIVRVRGTNVSAPC